jgi:hypothetical protein
MFVIQQSENLVLSRWLLAFIATPIPARHKRAPRISRLLR